MASNPFGPGPDPRDEEWPDIEMAMEGEGFTLNEQGEWADGEGNAVDDARGYLRDRRGDELFHDRYENGD